MSQTICKYFQRGACTKGSRCLFSHTPSAARAAPTVICPHFLLGKCRYGDKCINDHTKGSPPAHHTEHRQESPSIRDTAVAVEVDEVTLPGTEAADAGSDKSRASPPLPPEIDSGEEIPDLSPKDQHISESSSSETLVSDNEHGDKGFTKVASEGIHAANTPSPLPSPFNHPGMLFSSDADGPAAHPPSEQLPCPVYALRGSCTSPDCRLPHFLTDRQYHLLITNPARPQSLCNFFVTKGSCSVSSCPLQHVLLPEEYQILVRHMDQGSPGSDPIPVAPGPAAPLCTFYSNGTCRNGHQCPYRHEGPPRHYERDTGHRTQNNVCKYHLSPQGCKHGSSCKFPHGGTSASGGGGWGGWGNNNEYPPQNDQADNEGDLGNTSSGHTRSSRPCRFGQNCHYGDKCLFSHDSDPAESDKAPEAPQESGNNSWNATSWDKTNDAKAWSPPPTETAPVNEAKSEWDDPGGGSWDEPGGGSWDEPGGGSWDEAADVVTKDDHQEQPEETSNVDGDQEGDQDSTPVGVDEHYDLDPPVVDFFNCTVKYGPGAIPGSVTTPFNTSTLLLSNLPPDVYDDSITTMIQPYGTPVEIGLEPAGGTALIKFEECLAASLAAQSLDGTEYQSKTLAATVNEAGVRLYEFARVSRTVKLTWTTPNCTAWFFYDSITEAKREVDRLNKLTFQGRQIEAEFDRPKKNQKNSFSVQIHGLPSDADSLTLKHSLKVHPELSTHIGPPSFTGDPVQRLQEELRCFGEVDNVEIAYDGPDMKTTGFAHFVTACAAAKAVGALNGKVHASLSGLDRLSAKHAYLIRHYIDRCIFTPIEASIETLRLEYKTCQILAVDRDESTVILRLFGPDQEEFMQARKCLDVLVSGEPLLVEGKPLWDPYFDLGSCQKQLARLNKKHNVHIGLDFLNRIVRVHGPRERRLEAEKGLFDLLELVHSQQFNVPLLRYSLHGLLNGGLEQLYNAIGPTKVDMDLIGRTLLVRGSEENKQKAEEILSALISSPEGDGDSRCSLCCVLPVNQVALPCGHLYCRSCLHTLIHSAIGPKFSGLKCVAEMRSDDDDDPGVSECSAFIPHQIFMQILSKEEQHDLLESSFLAHIHESPDKFFYCPTPYCTSVFPAQNSISGAMLRCPTCSTWICPSCRVTFHEGLECEDYKAVSMGNESTEQEQEGPESRALVIIS
ncbi:hypothetical protein EDD85DRAFT_827810 [Armillaria nabsnona]|nr:hypothetical protein EDD85DRAFT_827810 [Armillaria nabsnona]